jgi:ferredoxin--NADP+ reductase
METPTTTDLFNASLVEREDLTPELAIFRIRYNDGDVPEFLPGQFTTLGLPPDPEEAQASAVPGRKRGPKLIRRAYSIASSPLQKEALDFYIVVVDGGKFTPKLWRLQPGDRIFMDRRISGHFTLEGVPDGKDLVCISTGTGLAPFVSMLKTYRSQPNRWRKFVVIHGTRLCVDLGYRAELEQIAREDPRVVYLPTCTREPDGSIWEGMRGRVHHLLEPDKYHQLVGHPLTPENAHVFLCGNPDMIDQCEKELQGRGFSVKDKKNPDGTIHFERYW